jgi:uncharacterized protein (DUF488 family)
MTARLATIGFTGSSAERFFDRLAKAGVTRVVDVRLRNSSQLAGFAKAKDLAFFLERIGGVGYVHEPLLAPSETLFKSYKTQKGDWRRFETSFLALMAERRIEERFKPSYFDGACLLCSEHEPHHCHRRLVCEYLNEKWRGGLAVAHL